MADATNTTNPSDWEKHAREHVAQIVRRFPNRAHWVPSARYLAQALDEIDILRDQASWRRSLDEREWGVGISGCPVCGIGSDGKPYAFACQRDDCPTRVCAALTEGGSHG